MNKQRNRINKQTERHNTKKATDRSFLRLIRHQRGPDREKIDLLPIAILLLLVFQQNIGHKHRSHLKMTNSVVYS